MKVKVDATSDNNNYPTICGIHEFESFDKALDYVYNAAKVFNPEVHDFIVDFKPNRYVYNKEKHIWVEEDIYASIEIYDDYRE